MERKKPSQKIAREIASKIGQQRMDRALDETSIAILEAVKNAVKVKKGVFQSSRSFQVIEQLKQFLTDYENSHNPVNLKFRLYNILANSHPKANTADYVAVQAIKNSFPAFQLITQLEEQGLLENADDIRGILQHPNINELEEHIRALSTQGMLDENKETIKMILSGRIDFGKMDLEALKNLQNLKTSSPLFKMMKGLNFSDSQFIQTPDEAKNLAQIHFLLQKMNLYNRENLAACMALANSDRENYRNDDIQNKYNRVTTVLTNLNSISDNLEYKIDKQAYFDKMMKHESPREITDAMLWLIGKNELNEANVNYLLDNMNLTTAFIINQRLFGFPNDNIETFIKNIHVLNDIEIFCAVENLFIRDHNALFELRGKITTALGKSNPREEVLNIINKECRKHPEHKRHSGFFYPAAETKIEPTLEDYKVLGVSQTASYDDVKKAFKKLALKCHSDKSGGGDEDFKILFAAFDRIRDHLKPKEEPTEERGANPFSP